MTAEPRCKVETERCAECGQGQYAHVDHEHVTPACPFRDCGNFTAIPCGEVLMDGTRFSSTAVGFVDYQRCPVHGRAGV